MPLFQKLKQNKQKTAWKLQDSEYCLFVDDEQRVELPDKKSTKRSDQISCEQSNSDSSDEEK